MRSRRISYNSPVVLTFALLSLAALLLGYVTGGRSTSAVFCVYRSSLADPMTYVRFFTHVLGHANYSHYINNILMILVIGPAMEEKYGSRSLLAMIMITAFVSGLVQYVFFPGTALLGASGIVFMLIILSSLSGMRSGEIPLTLVFVFIFYVGGEIVTALTQSDSISQLTHVVGGVCGAVLGFCMAGGRKRP